jgi:hypothetical protein
MKLTPEEQLLAQRALVRLNARYDARREFQKTFPQEKKAARDDNPHVPRGYESSFLRCQRNYEGFSE